MVSAVGGLTEIITDGFNGLLVKRESYEDIAEKVVSLMNDSATMQRLSDNAIVDSTARFSPKIVADQTVEYYRKIIANHS